MAQSTVKKLRVESIKRTIRRMNVAESVTMTPIKRAIFDAQKELLAELRKLTAYGVRRNKISTRHLKQGLAAIARLERVIADSIAASTDGLGHRAVAEAAAQANALNDLFGRRGELPVSLNAAEITATNAKGIGTRIKNNSGYVSQKLGADVRRELTIASLKSETFAEMTARLEKKLPGRFVQAQHAAERVVRTEMMSAYNTHHAQAIDALNEDDPGWVQRWDASADLRRCILCKSLDGKIAAVGKSFGGGVTRGPVHPGCRCCVTPWRIEWGGESSAW